MFCNNPILSDMVNLGFSETKIKQLWPCVGF